MSQVALMWRKILFYTWNFFNMRRVTVLQVRFHQVFPIAGIWLTYRLDRSVCLQTYFQNLQGYCDVNWQQRYLFFLFQKYHRGFLQITQHLFHTSIFKTKLYDFLQFLFKSVMLYSSSLYRSCCQLFLAVLQHTKISSSMYYI